MDRDKKLGLILLVVYIIFAIMFFYCILTIFKFLIKSTTEIIPYFFEKGKEIIKEELMS